MGSIFWACDRWCCSALDVEVLYVKGVVFDELAARLDVFTHQRGEDGFSLGDVLEFDGEQGAPLGIHSRLPQLRRSHLAEALVALDLVVAAALLDDVLEEFSRRLLLDGLLRLAAALRTGGSGLADLRIGSL